MQSVIPTGQGGFRARAALAACAALWLALGCGPHREAETGRVSAVLVVIDTLRADRMGLYGHTRPTTPALERIAEHALVFERAYATSCWTLPSFASLVTGQRARRHAAGRWVGRDVEDSAELATSAVIVQGRTKRFSALDPARPSLPAVLREAGYATAAIVDNPFLDPAFGLDRGFEHYDHASGGDNYGRRADVMVDAALAWVEQPRDRPFFLLLHLYDPHMNYDAPPPMGGRFSDALNADGALERPVRGPGVLRRLAPRLDPQVRRFVRAAYDEEIAFVDQQLGRLLERLGAGTAGAPLVAITADHGEELFDHESFGHGHTLFEEQLHVPLLLLGPRVVPGRSDVPVSIADVAPTLLEALGVPAPDGLDGRSLWPAASRGESLPPRPVFAGRTGEGPDRRAVIDWPWKLIETAGSDSPELYDLSRDPDEREDHSARHPEVVARLRGQLEIGPAPVPTGPPVELDARTEERLRRLGYLDSP